jgi:alkylation response protein AidB-like acyl-CoA dehydrogenase
MPNYTAPVADMLFILHDVLGLDDRETSEAVLTEAARFAENVLQPLNRTGDEDGAKLEGGSVITVPGFKQAYHSFVEGGWQSLACATEHGGQGLGTPLQFAVAEMINAANISFSLAPLLTAGAYHALSAHGSEDLKQRYLPKLVSGEWPGTMCLTEPQCGTDLGLLKSRAAPNTDGSYTITGTKIFITYGDHDMADNIVHLVLARLPEAPAGVKGISLFLCPKVLDTGDRNAVKCTALEKKMGIKASPTCVMNFDGATAWIVGEPHRGLACMFTMMNDARLLVGIQGLGLASAAIQNATSYARTRLQMRAPTGPKNPEGPADPIIVHPDIRRLLLTNRAMIEGCRALALWVAQELDISHKHADPARRQQAEDRVALLTPVVKSMLTDLGSQAANDGVQVHGGHGFIRDTGAEQFVRDARICQIYEGTNGIQALDLVGRKVPMHEGRLVADFFATVTNHIRQSPATMAEFTTPLSVAVKNLEEATTWLTRNANNREETASAATDYLRLFGLVAIGHMWCRMVAHATPQSPKPAVARVYFTKILPETASLLARVMSGAVPLMALPGEDV